LQNYEVGNNLRDSLVSFDRWVSQERFNLYECSGTRNFGSSDQTYTHREDTDLSPHMYTKEGAWVTFNNM
jgi:hypothetical protein